MRRRRRLRVFLLALVAALAVGVGVTFYFTGVLESLELDSVNARFEVRGDKRPPSDLVVVGVDAATLNRLREQWPFPRAFHAKLIDRLRAGGAKVIAFDIAFSEPGRERKRFCNFAGDDLAPGDCSLLVASSRAKNHEFSAVDVGKGATIPFFGFPASPQVMRQFGARAGYTGVEEDDGGVERRYLYGFNGLPSFASVVAQQEGRTPPPRSAYGSDGTTYIDYYGGPGSIPTVPYWKVYEGKTPPGYFRGKTVVVGATDPTLKDVFHTSTSGNELMSGPEVQAHAIGTVRRGNPLREASDLVNVLLIVLLGLVAPAAGLALRLKAIAIAVAVGLAFTAAVQIAFGGQRIVAFVYPLLALVIGTLGTLVVQYFTETRERRRTRDLFTRFVPENVVDEVLDRTDDDLRLGGVQREGTVMFSDLRGFTSFAERMPVDRVIEVLNRYLGEMSEAILDNGGTLVAYMGDGIMAVFGAPIEQPDHADRGLAAAIEMRDIRLPAFNKWLEQEGLADDGGFRMGIGLNSGPVMSGNVGSQRRLEYTAIGDTTNTASRIEGMTKGTPHQLLMSLATVELLRRHAGRPFSVGEFEVRGREQHISLWSMPDGDGGRSAGERASTTEGAS
jgi:adenylate cyclase